MSFWDDKTVPILLVPVWALLAMYTVPLWIPHDCPSDLFFRPIFTFLLAGWTVFCDLWLTVFLLRKMVRRKRARGPRTRYRIVIR